MNANYFMYCATGLYLISTVPDIYANYKNKNANLYNLLDKSLLLIACGLGLTYGIVTSNIPIIINYTPSLFLDSFALSLRIYYASQNKFKSLPGIQNTSTVIEIKDCEEIVIEV